MSEEVRRGAGDIRSLRWVIRGLVQGVGFRWFVLNRAQALGVRGWARNLPDGAVEVVGAASPEALERFEAVLRRGPPGAHIREVVVGEVPQQDVDTKSFTIKH